MRVLRADGSPVLDTAIRWREFAPTAVSNAAGDLFALTTAGMDVDHVRGSPFHGTDLAAETVRVHRASDGREVFSIRLQAPLPARQPVALSPGGREIAVIDGGKLLLYAATAGASTASQGPAALGVTRAAK